MPLNKSNDLNTVNNTVFDEDVQEIIEEVPGWILKWGVFLFFAILLSIIALSALIKYPDIVHTTLKINSTDSPKPVVSKVAGKLVKLLRKENEFVKSGEPLAFMESTADHTAVLELLKQLRRLQGILRVDKSSDEVLIKPFKTAELGELQGYYQTFYVAYLSYKSTSENGFLRKKRSYLQKDISDLIKQQIHLKNQIVLQQKDLRLSEEDYRMHQKLSNAKVETTAELRQQESKYLLKQAPVLQTEAALISAGTDFSAKQKEILELDNQVTEEKLKFSQALNSLISQTEDWSNKFILIASQSGRLSYAGIVQENQVLTTNQEIFYINPGNPDFFGEMVIPQYSMGKVKEGQEVLIKMRSYPFEEYGMIEGRIKYISDVPYKDSIFLSKVEMHTSHMSDINKPIHLKSGMMADAEIVTQDASVFQRISRNITKIIDQH